MSSKKSTKPTGQESDTAKYQETGQRLYDADTAKGRLLIAAASLFSERGYARTTVRDIAADVGILSGSIFHHFPNKESILRAVMEQAILSARSRMDRGLVAAKDTPSKLKALITCELESVHGFSDPGFTLLVSEWADLSPESQAEILKMRNAYEAVWLGVLDQAFKQHLILVQSFIMRSFIRGAVTDSYNWYQADGDISLVQLSEAIFNVVSCKS